MRNLLAVLGVLMAISLPGYCWKYHKKHGYISLDLIRHKTVREHILNGPKYGVDLNYLLEKPPRTNDSISLKRYLDNEYYGEIIIGHPGQRMVVAFDTAWELTWMMSKKCQIFLSPACKVHNLYDDTRSSLYKPNGTKYGDPAYNYTGFYSYETIKIAHSNATNFSFVEMTQVPNSFIGEKADGVVGLGLAPSDGSYEPYFYALYRQKKIKNNLFSVFINRDPQSTQGGSIMLGYINPKHIHTTRQPDGSIKPDDITYLDVTGNDIYWQFRMDKIVITKGAKQENHTLCDNGCDAIVDTTSNRIRGPPENITYIRQLVDAKQFGDLWLLDCSKIRKLPKVYFVLGGHYCKLDGPLYVMQMSNLSSTVCVLAFDDQDSPGFKDMWILGGAFLSQYYSIYNIDERKIGFVRTP